MRSIIIVKVGTKTDGKIIPLKSSTLLIIEVDITKNHNKKQPNTRKNTPKTVHTVLRHLQFPTVEVEIKNIIMMTKVLRTNDTQKDHQTIELIEKNNTYLEEIKSRMISHISVRDMKIEREVARMSSKRTIPTIRNITKRNLRTIIKTDNAKSSENHTHKNITKMINTNENSITNPVDMVRSIIHQKIKFRR